MGAVGTLAGCIDAVTCLILLRNLLIKQPREFLRAVAGMLSTCAWWFLAVLTGLQSVGILYV